MSHFPTRRGAVVLAVLALAAALPAAGQAQTGAYVMPATLLKRLGAAVDGYRTGKLYWVAADTTFPHHVWGVTLTKTGATQLAAAHPYAMPFGPFLGNDPDQAASGAGGGAPANGAMMVSTEVTWPPKCIKMWDSQCITPDTSAALFHPMPASFKARWIIIGMLDASHQGRVDTLSADSVGAVFFTMSEIDKLLIPYYSYLYGSREAARIREEIRQQ